MIDFYIPLKTSGNLWLMSHFQVEHWNIGLKWAESAKCGNYCAKCGNYCAKCGNYCAKVTKKTPNQYQLMSS